MIILILSRVFDIFVCQKLADHDSDTFMKVNSSREMGVNFTQ